MSDVEKRVKRAISEMIGVDESTLSNEKKFVEDLGADSLDWVQIIMKLEGEFEIEISDEDAEKISTVQQSIDYIKGRVVDQ